MKKPQLAVSAYVTDSPVHKKSNKSPQLRAGSGSHYTFKVNQKKPQSANSGYATHAPVHNGKAGTQSHYTAEGNQVKPELEISGYAANDARAQRKVGKPNQRRVDLNLNLEIPQAVVSGVQVVTVDKHSQLSTVTRRRQGYANVLSAQDYTFLQSNQGSGRTPSIDQIRNLNSERITVYGK